LARLLEQVD